MRYLLGIQRLYSHHEAVETETLYRATVSNLQGNLMERHVSLPWWTVQGGKYQIVIPAASMALFNT